MYHYIAYDSKNERHRGDIHAINEVEVRQQLREQGLSLFELEVEKNAMRFTLFSAQKKLSQNDITLLMRQLAELLSSGLPVVQSLSLLVQQVEKKSIQSFLHKVRDRVNEGYSFASSLKYFQAGLPDLLISTIAAAEESGHLEETVQHLAEYSEKKLAIQQKTQQALVYPLLMTFVSITIVTFLLIYVVPKITDVYVDANQQLPAMTMILLAMTDFLTHYGWVMIGLIIILIIANRYCQKNPSIAYKTDRAILRFPTIGKIALLQNSSVFTRILGVLLASGVDIIEAMGISAKLITNRYMQQKVVNATLKVREGSSIAFALRNTGVFMPITINFIANGEKSGNLEKMLNKIASIHENDVTRRIDMFLTMFEPLLILVMGAIVLFIVLAMLLPMFDMVNLV